MMNQWSQGAFYYYCFKTFKTQNFTIKLSNHLLKVNQIKQLPVGTILSFYYFGKTVHLRFCSSVRTFQIIISRCMRCCLRMWASACRFPPSNEKFLSGQSFLLPKFIPTLTRSCGHLSLCANTWGLALIRTYFLPYSPFSKERRRAGVLVGCLFVRRKRCLASSQGK